MSSLFSSKNMKVSIDDSVFLSTGDCRKYPVGTVNTLRVLINS